MVEIRIAILGVGNCCSALVQGVEFYKKNKNKPLGLIYWKVGNYLPSDLKFVVAFDIDKRKVGKDLSEAILAEPNTIANFITVPKIGATVLKGPILDGVGEYVRDMIQIDRSKVDDVAEAFKKYEVDIVVNLLPSGAIKATSWYADQALKAGCAFINATPTLIASDKVFKELFKKRGLPLVGDDLMDQIGATILHMGLLRFLNERGVHIDQSYQLDVGGGAESLSTLERVREIKREIKTEVVSSVVPYRFPLIAGSTDFVDFLKNRRDSLFWIKGSYFCGAPLRLDIRLETVEGFNAGSILLDVIRAVKLAMDRGITGPLKPISAYGFKVPPERMNIWEARRRFEDFITEK